MAAPVSTPDPPPTTAEKQPVDSSIQRPKKRRFGAHTGAPLAVLILAVWLVVTAWIRFRSPDTTSCTDSYPADFWLTGGFTMIIAAFLLGGLLGSIPRHAPDKGTAGARTQVGVTAVVAIIAGALFYETRAVAAGTDSILPITHFVMCIKHLENDWTVMVFILAALLAGRWLWHRSGTYLQ